MGTAVAAKCLVPQEAVGLEGGGARQLVLNNVSSTYTISSKLGGSGQELELLPWQQDPFPAPLFRPKCSFLQRQKRTAIF